MANYSNVKGFTVQTLASDTIPSQFGGGAWSSGPAMNTARGVAASGGPSTSSMVMGGADPSSDYTATSETFNGTAWTQNGEEITKAILRGIYRRNGDVFKLYTLDNLSNGKFILATGTLDMVKKTLNFKASYVE